MLGAGDAAGRHVLVHGCGNVGLLPVAAPPAGDDAERPRHDPVRAEPVGLLGDGFRDEKQRPRDGRPQSWRAITWATTRTRCSSTTTSSICWCFRCTRLRRRAQSKLQNDHAALRRSWAKALSTVAFLRDAGVRRPGGGQSGPRRHAPRIEVEQCRHHPQRARAARHSALRRTDARVAPRRRGQNRSVVQVGPRHDVRPACRAVCRHPVWHHGRRVRLRGVHVRLVRSRDCLCRASARHSRAAT